MENIELGIDTFGDVTVDAAGVPLPQPQVIRNVVEEAVLAEQVGLDFFGLGEHHREDFAVSAPDVVLATIAGRTERIHLGSAVTVLSSDDPVRVFQRFATLDALSGGRAEVILGRGSFTESFPLFGHELSDYEVLFEEKLDLFTALLAEEPVTWSGHDTCRSAGPAGVPDDRVRPAHLGRRRRQPRIGGAGRPARPAAHAGDHRRRPAALRPVRRPVPASARRARPAASCPSGCTRPGHVADTDERAKQELWPHYREMHARIGRERGWPPMTRTQFELATGPEGALAVGSPETVADKIVRAVSGLGCRSLRPQVQRRHAAPRGHAAQHRAVRHRGRPAGARAARRGRGSLITGRAGRSPAPR